MTETTFTIPTAHIDDPTSVVDVLATLSQIHGPDYEFALERWAGEEDVHPLPGRTIYRFLIETNNAAIDLHPGEWVRGAAEDGHCVPVDGSLARVVTHHSVELWPGDVVCVDAHDDRPAILHGEGVYFEVIAESTGYRAPRVGLLRNLGSIPGGCAAYPGAFRRETLPPQRPAADAPDQRGVNRVTEHTLDMRIDRNPPPIRHFHGPIPVGDGRLVNHSETAIVLPRSVYGLPEVDRADEGHLVIYRRPAEDPTDTVRIPVRPGSIVVTPATTEVVMGHAFENCFAMLVAIPGFVAPYNMIEE
ncbi:MAG: hypothetical protein R2856_23665 [Caldilineaceae bacterium]